jgi:hypothetical protein
MWKIVEVFYRRNEKLVIDEYVNVAAVRVDGSFLVIRRGSYPMEKICRVNLADVESYDVSPEYDSTEFRSFDYDEGDE